MRFLLKLLVTSLAVFFSAYILPGVYLAGFPTAILVALLMGFLNAFLKPILVILTIPITLITFGLFLLVINAAIIKLADYALDGFSVNSFLTAVLFSIIVSVVTWILEAIANPKPKREQAE
ncbi:MAG: phage holin family protein [Lentimicrobiaceae bacterium]|jgi:putative membrane protein